MRIEDIQYAQFEEAIIVKVVEQSDGGWAITRDDGWSLFVPAGSVSPKVGSTLRVYGRGIGYPYRGLAIDGDVSFYRTEEEDREYQANELFGRDGQEALRRWDAGEIVWSVSMGGFGPGYEQAIQVTAFEVLRHLIETKADVSDEGWAETRERASSALMSRLGPLGLSGMQWGAGLHLGTRFYRDGPRKVHDTCPKDRRIMVSDHWPTLKVRPA